MNFKQNEHVKLTETPPDTQVLSKEYPPDVMDFLERLTFIDNET